MLSAHPRSALLSLDGRRIKWSFATRTVPHAPEVGALALRPSGPSGPPRAGDVIVAEVEPGEIRRLDLHDGRRSLLFPGDLVGVVYGFRNPGRRPEGGVPEDPGRCELLTSGGLCGRTLGPPEPGPDPTVLVPRAWLQDRGGTVNLAQFTLWPRTPVAKCPRLIVAVGTGTGSGKTSAACALVHGLTRGGWRVAAGKPCGTASSRDIGWLADAGAAPVLDFLDAGHASTARCTPLELERIVDVLDTNLAARGPDFILFELASGIFQRESSVVLASLVRRGRVAHALFAAHDSLGVREGLACLRALGVDVLAVSGRITSSPLATREAAQESDVPVLTPEELALPECAAQLIGGGALHAPLALPFAAPPIHS